MTKMKKTIKIRQVGSAIRRNKRQLMYLRSLGLKRIGSEKALEANDCVLKLIAKVRHMVKIVSE